MIKYIVFFLLTLSACNFDMGNSSSQDQDNDVTTIDNSQNGIDGAGDSVCKGTQSIDGPGGFLWKPVSESDGNLAVLFPEEYEEFDSVLAELAEGEIDVGVSGGIGEDGRQVWRFSLPGEAYAGRLIVEAGDSSCEWIVNDPAERQD